MLRAIILDFDGVIAASEDVHLAAFQEVVLNEGIDLSREDYYERYLAFDDRTVLRRLFADRGRRLEPARLAALAAAKREAFAARLVRGIPLCPGAEEFTRSAAASVPLAIASGALRSEIDDVLTRAGLRALVTVIVSAEDVAEGKPSPEPFRRALEELNAAVGGPSIAPRECVVVEDSPHGIVAARAAGMRCVAVATSYPPDRLDGADTVVPTLAALQLQDVAELCV